MWDRGCTRRARWYGTSSGRPPVTTVSAPWARYAAFPSLARLLFKAAARSYARDTAVRPPTTAVSRNAFASGLPRFRLSPDLAHPWIVCFPPRARLYSRRRISYSIIRLLSMVSRIL